MNTQWTQAKAIELCKVIETICPPYGCHVALTGGCLYGPTEPRKDCDILFYRIRQVKCIDLEGLWLALEKIGFIRLRDEGWCHKAKFYGHTIDIFFPESDSTVDAVYPHESQ